MQSLIEFDQELFLILNGIGHPHLDQLMLFISAKLVWIPLYLLIIYGLYRKYKLHFWKPLLVIIIGVVAADQITSGFMKPFFERLRPCRDPMLEGLVVNIGKCGGKYGFASSHAANTMIVAFLTHFALKNKWTPLLFGWALITGYSRIYLGVHYPADVIVGFLVSLILFLAVAKIAEPRLHIFNPASA